MTAARLPSHELERSSNAGRTRASLRTTDITNRSSAPLPRGIVRIHAVHTAAKGPQRPQLAYLDVTSGGGYNMVGHQLGI